MPLPLSRLISTDALGKTTPKVALESLTAKAGFAPHAWQSTAPDQGFKAPVSDSEDLQRVLALPRRPPVTTDSERAAALVELMTARFARVNNACECRSRWKRDCIKTLRPIQAIALYELGIAGGLVGAIGTGHGKSFLDMLSPLALQQTRGCETAVVLIPPKLVTQFISDYELLSQHFHVPSLVVHGQSYVQLVEGAPTLHVLPYSRLSGEKYTTKLDEIAPDFIIADEFQNIANPDSVRTGRVLLYADSHEELRAVILSGSLSDDSINDYAHGSALSLKRGSPLPLKPDNVQDWARAIDPSDWPAPPGALLKLCDPGEHVQCGFHRRLVDTLGFIATQEPSIDAELCIEERRPPTMPEEVAEALKALRDTWKRPDGEELVDALSVARCARELAAGFFLYWYFPKINGVPQSPTKILEWLDARKEYRCEQREMLRDRGPHFDSPLLVTRAARRFHGDESYDEADRLARGLPPLPVWGSRHWPRWRDTKETIKYETRTMRVHDYLARDAAEWAMMNRGIVWYRNPSFGRWISELSGLPLYGVGGRELKTDKGAIVEDGTRSIVVSAETYGTGFDGLQPIFDDQLITQPMSSSVKWEQLLGRTFRIGQPSPVIRASVYRHTPELSDAVDDALARAEYVQRTLGSPQKLLSGIKPNADGKRFTGRVYDEEEGE
jgi:hypothetical protein